MIRLNPIRGLEHWIIPSHGIVHRPLSVQLADRACLLQSGQPRGPRGGGRRRGNDRDRNDFKKVCTLCVFSTRYSYLHPIFVGRFLELSHQA
jgi:hypothetical protein